MAENSLHSEDPKWPNKLSQPEAQSLAVGPLIVS